MCAKISRSLGALAFSIALLSVPALAQEVWQTHPMSHRTGTVSSTVTPAVRMPTNRPLYDVVPPQARQPFAQEVWQTYPISPYGD